MLFGRKPSTPESAPVKEGGKGHATPTRKEAEAAAKARAKTPRTRAEQMRAQREKARAAMASGDERYLPARDKGPVRHFLRDWVDSRINIGELMLPVAVLGVASFYVGNRSVAVFGELLVMVCFVMVIISSIGLRFRVRKELARRFPDVSPKGHIWYAILRSTQLRIMRQPKPQVKIGTQLPDSYR